MNFSRNGDVKNDKTNSFIALIFAQNPIYKKYARLNLLYMERDWFKFPESMTTSNGLNEPKTQISLLPRIFRI